QQGKTQVAVSLLPLFEQHRVNVTFEVVDGNQRLLQSKRQRLGVTDADQQGSGQPWPLGNGNRVNRLVASTRIRQRLANHWNDGAQMLARCQFRNYAAV